MALDESRSSISCDLVYSKSFLEKAIVGLLCKLATVEERFNDSTLAITLMLASFGIFFFDPKHEMKIIEYVAQEVSARSRKKQTSNYSTTREPHIYNSTCSLMRWFTYIGIIGSLTAEKTDYDTQRLQSLRYGVPRIAENVLISDLRTQLRDIEYSSGMDPIIFSFLTDVSGLIRLKRASGRESNNSGIIQRAMSLDSKIVAHLDKSERERNSILSNIHYRPEIKIGELKTYNMLRATNLLFGLTAILQLRRRVLCFSHQEKSIKDLLFEATRIIHTRIPSNNQAECCILLCLFCCGCELVDKSLVEWRVVYMNRLESLEKRGVSSVSIAKGIMLKCWKERTSWWDVLGDMNLDISLAI